MIGDNTSPVSNTSEKSKSLSFLFLVPSFIILFLSAFTYSLPPDLIPFYFVGLILCIPNIGWSRGWVKYTSILLLLFFLSLSLSEFKQGIIQVKRLEKIRIESTQHFVSVNAPDEIKDILIKAKNLTENTKFKSSIEINGMTVLTYHMLDADGKSLDRTEQVFKNNTLELVYLYTANGYYEWSNTSNSIIKSTPTFQMLSTWQRFLNMVTIDNDAAFSKEDIIYYDIPCYKITMTHEFPDSGKAITAYTIGKENHFIYSCSWKNKQMEKPIVTEWGNVVFNPTFDNKIFEVPTDKTMEVVKTKDEYGSARKKLFFKLNNPQ